MTNLGAEREFVTATIGGQLFGIAIERVLDVFAVDRLTRVPLAPPQIAGVFNLRGRIVTVLDMRKCLDMPGRSNDGAMMAIGIERGGESFGLLVDTVGEVLKLPAGGRETNPVNLDAGWARVADGIYPLDGKLMVVLEADRIIDRPAEALAA